MIKIAINSKAEVKIAPFFEPEDGVSLSETIQSIYKNINTTYIADFKGKSKETAVCVLETGVKIMFLGLGKKKNGKEISSVFRSFFYKQKANFTANVSIDINNEEIGSYAENIANGVFLAEYNIGIYKTANKPQPDWFKTNSVLSFEVSKALESDILKAAEKGKMMADTQKAMIKLVDAPANYKTPSHFEKILHESGKTNNYEVQVFDEKKCLELGLHALLAVGKGSLENPPKFLLAHYKNEKATKTVALIGKGVTFDTGGVSLKPGDNMNYMKSDMGGAAAVMGTIEMAAKLKLPINIIMAVPVTENCIDSFSIKPGDVIGSYSGKTIEVINTDAEGRLILADALAYVNKNYTPDVMIDLATLTGNCIQALGYEAAALLSNNDTLAEKFKLAGEKSGEKTWQMPLWPEYADMMKSDVADVKNLSTIPIAGAITAAKFLEEFIGEHKNWAHLDIAGMAFGSSEYGSMKSATGYGISLLTSYLESEC